MQRTGLATRSGREALRFDQLQAGSDGADGGDGADGAAGAEGASHGADRAASADDGGLIGPGAALARIEAPPIPAQRLRIDVGLAEGSGSANAQTAVGSGSATAEHIPSVEHIAAAEHTAAIEHAASASTSAATAAAEPPVSTAVADKPEPGAAEAPPSPLIVPAVAAVSDIIRTAAEQAAATWRVASVPAQRRQSPVVAFAPPGATPAPPAPPAEPAAEPEPASAGPESPELAEPSERSEPPTSSEPPQSPQSGTQPPESSDAEPGLDDRHWPNARRQIALLVRVVAVLVLAVLVGHRFLPDVMGFGSLIDTFLPWTFVPLLLALPAALLSLDKWAIGVTVLACGVWGGDFGPQLARSTGSGPADLKILSQNVSSPPDLAAVARLAEQRQADIVVLQGMSAHDIEQADQTVPARYPYHLALYEFVVWSRFKLADGGVPVDLAVHPAGPAAAQQAAGTGQFGGLLRFTVQVDQARSATVYAVHLPQPSLSHDGFGVARGGALDQLVKAVRAEPEPNLVVVGDLDLAQTDRGMGKLVGSATGLESVQAKAGGGFGFTWPSSFPMIRLDDVLTRGLVPVRSVVLPAVGAHQAHRPIEADLRFGASPNQGGAAGAGGS